MTEILDKVIRDIKSATSFKVIDKISQEIFNFAEKYGTRPKYVKMPCWIYEGLMHYSSEIFLTIDNSHYTNDEGHYIMGLKICPTIAIDDISEIEVF